VKPRTKFVTFYSYKGGVGRTSAMINAAVHRARAGDRVVVIDFDLEAPGISNYLSAIDSNYNPNKRGILEYIYDALNKKKVPSLIKSAAELSEKVRGTNGGALWAINAGNTSNSSYAKMLEDLRWGEIFEKRHGEILLTNLKNQIIREFDSPDYVFIDSRTGITETGGICTRYLADSLVILTSLNEQNINGTAMVYKELVEDSKPALLVASNVPVGMPTDSNQLFTERINSFNQKFEREPDLFIYYYPSLSLSENVPLITLGKSFNKPRSTYMKTEPLILAYKNLAREIDRANEDSFQRVLALADLDLRRILYEDEDELIYIKQLEANYPNRKLSKIMLKAFELAKNCLANSDQPNKWKEKEVKNLISQAKAITHKSSANAIASVNFIFAVKLRGHLSHTGKMKVAYEVFSDEEGLTSIALSEISRKNYEWPKSYYLKRLKALKTEDNNKNHLASVLYNLSQCQIRTNESAKAVRHLKEFVSIAQTLDTKKTQAITQANIAFCTADAFSLLGKWRLAMNMIKQCNSILGQLQPSEKVFSPVDYQSVSLKEFENHIKLLTERVKEKRSIL